MVKNNKLSGSGPAARLDPPKVATRVRIPATALWDSNVLKNASTFLGPLRPSEESRLPHEIIYKLLYQFLEAFFLQSSFLILLFLLLSTILKHIQFCLQIFQHLSESVHYQFRQPSLQVSDKNQFPNQLMLPDKRWKAIYLLCLLWQQQLLEKANFSNHR